MEIKYRITKIPSPVTRTPRLINRSVCWPCGSFLITRVRNNNPAKVNIPSNPHEIPNNGSIFKSLLPNKSSQENTVVEEQNEAPSLIFDEIQKVWAETAKPKNVIICNPAVTWPRVVCSISNREDNESATDFPWGRVRNKPNKTGNKYAASKRLSNN